MKTKEEVIKEAWGKHWETLTKRGKEQALDDNGYCHKNHVHSDLDCEIEVHSFPDTDFIRPKSLTGIENYYSFVDIKEFENYKINRQGLIISKRRVSTQKNGKTYTVKEKVMTPQLDNTGYIVFGLRSNGKTKKVYLHSVLAEAFIPNPENKPCVNHKNGVKYDNTLSNLEWCTHKENNIHAFNNNLNTTIGHRLKGKKGKESHNYGKGRKVYSENKIYNNIKEASKDLNLSVGYLYQCLCGSVPNRYKLSYQPIVKPKPPIY